MVNPQLLEYIKQELAAQNSKETIKSRLLAQGGWSIQDIEQAFSALEPVSIPRPENPVPQKKSSLTGIVILLVVIVLGTLAGFYVYSQKNQSTTTAVKETPLQESTLVATQPKMYYNPNFGFSFEYPENWSVTALTGAAQITPRLDVQNNNTPEVLHIDFIDQRDSLTVAKNFFSTSSVSISGFPTEIYTLNNMNYDKNNQLVPTGGVTWIYKIKLGSYYGSDMSISVLTSVPSASAKISDEALHIINSITLNRAIFEGALTALRERQLSGADAATKSNMSNLRSAAEIYYDSANSYKGFCGASTEVSILKSTFPNTHIECRDTANSYIVTGALTTDFYCIDSTGYAGLVKTSNNLNTCTR